MRIKLSLATIIALLAALLTSASPVSAAPIAEKAPTLNHCVLHGIAVADGHVGAVPQPTRACYSTFAAAIADATGGVVKLPAVATQLSQQQYDKAQSAASLSRIASTTSNQLVGIEYKDKNLKGQVLYLSSTGPCTSGTHVDFPSLAPLGWNNTISSAVSYSACLSAHFQYDNFGGPKVVCNCYSNLGALNDLTSSIRFSVNGA